DRRHLRKPSRFHRGLRLRKGSDPGARCWPWEQYGLSLLPEEDSPYPSSPAARKSGCGDIDSTAFPPPWRRSPPGVYSPGRCTYISCRWDGGAAWRESRQGFAGGHREVCLSLTYWTCRGASRRADRTCGWQGLATSTDQLPFPLLPE